MEPAKDAAVNLLQTISTEAFGAEMVAAQGVLRQNCEACSNKAEPFREMSKSMWHLLAASCLDLAQNWCCLLWVGEECRRVDVLA